MDSEPTETTLAETVKEIIEEIFQAAMENKQKESIRLELIDSPRYDSIK